MNFTSIEEKFVRFQFKSDTKTRQRLWKKLSKLLKDGIPIISGLEEIRGLKKPSAPISRAIGSWIRVLNNGGGLADAVKAWVTTEEYMLIMAGEKSGTLDDALMSVVKVAKAKASIQSAVIGGIAYPAFLLLISFGLLYMLGFKIVPAFTKSARSDAWVGQAKAMIATSHFVQSYLHWLGVLIVVLLIAFFIALPRWNSSTRIFLDRYPPFSIYRVMQGSSWLIALAALVQAGMRMESAIEQLGQGSSTWANLRYQSALKGLRAGLNLGRSLEKGGYGFPDPEIISDIRIYATKAGLDEALRLIGEDWITESVERIQGLMKLVFGATMLVVAVLIVFTVSGLISMQLQLTQLLQRGSH